MPLARGAAIALLASLLVAAPASASRPATPAEKSKLAAQEGLTPVCATARISTVDPSWGRISSTDAVGCSADHGYGVQRRQGNGFRRVTMVSMDIGACPVPLVPTPVARDLSLCRKPKAYLLCLPRKGRSPDRVVREQPRRCSTVAVSDPFAQAANLARVRWRRWGRRVARGRGIDLRFRRPHPRIRVRLKAYRRRQVCGGDYLYTRLRVTSRRGTWIVRFPRRCGD